MDTISLSFDIYHVMIRGIVLVSICMFGICYAAFSQSTIDKYCEIEAYYKTYTEAFTIRFIPGNVDSIFSFKDSSVVTGLKKVNGLKSISDAFNLLANQGWKFIAVVNKGGGRIEFLFKKEFDPKDLN
jgi:hypothetical protein